MYNFGLAFLFYGTFRLAYEHFVGYAGYFISTVAVEQNYIVDVGAVFYKFIVLQPCSYKPVSPVYVKFFVCFDNLCRFYCVE